MTLLSKVLSPSVYDSLLCTRFRVSIRDRNRPALANNDGDEQHRVELQARVWPHVAATRPQAWVWTGDAVYAQNHSLASLQSAFAQQTAVPSYQEFVASGVKVDGVWGE